MSGGSFSSLCSWLSPCCGGMVRAVRDLLTWAGFVDTAAGSLGPLAAYVHGAHLTLLDGLGLGVGLSSEVCSGARAHPYCSQHLSSSKVAKVTAELASHCASHCVLAGC
jgi:hypothetical protein